MKFNPNRFILIIGLLILVTVGIAVGFYYFKNPSLENLENFSSEIITDTQIQPFVQIQPFIASGVVPHHLLADEIIENFFEYLFSKGSPESIILLSPDHLNNGNLCEKISFITLEPERKSFKAFKIDNYLLENLIKENEFCFNNSFVAFEHGVTNLLPYIKKFSSKTKILPILIPQNIDEEQVIQLIKTIDFYSSPHSVILASVVFSHYFPKNVAQFHDSKSIRVLLTFEKENLRNLEVDCWQCLYGIRLFAKLRQKEFPKIIGYNASENISEIVLERTTSYFSLIFEKEELKKSKIEEYSVQTILFVGDIMLDRKVEYLMKKNSVFYPFERINQFLRGIDIVVGNLEGPIVKNPPEFSRKSLRFAFSNEALKSLSFANFNLFSLANNHTLDVGKAGYEQTKELLREANIDFVGHPVECEKDFFFEKNNIIFLAFNKTFRFNCSEEKIVETIRKTKIVNLDKFLIVILHWGNEYQSKSSISQRKFAHQIIKAGGDLIIGHHPHVVQEIEEYQGKLIFYSLGNFIFDQYFSKETQESLAVGLELYPQKVIYRLFPLKSHLSQPFLMKEKEKKEFLENLALKSSPGLLEKIKEGIIIK